MDFDDSPAQALHAHPNALCVSPAGLELIKLYHRFCEQPRRAQSGFAEIGFGHVLRPIDDDLLWISVQHADTLLREDLRCVEIYLNATVRVVLEQREFDALASLVFDVGMLNFEHSTLRVMLNAGDKPGAADALRHWGAHRVLADDLPGRARRNAEATMFLRGELVTSD
jgi:lysozyme